jgi:hypothetical protein
MASTRCSVFHVKRDQSDPFDTTVMALRQHYRVDQRRLNPIPTIGFIHRLVRKRDGVDVSGPSDEVCAAVGEESYQRLHSRRVCAFSAMGLRKFFHRPLPGRMPSGRPLRLLSRLCKAIAAFPEPDSEAAACCPL